MSRHERILVHLDPARLYIEQHFAALATFAVWWLEVCLDKQLLNGIAAKHLFMISWRLGKPQLLYVYK